MITFSTHLSERSIGKTPLPRIAQLKGMKPSPACPSCSTCRTGKATHAQRRSHVFCKSSWRRNWHICAWQRLHGLCGDDHLPPLLAEPPLSVEFESIPLCIGFFGGHMHINFVRLRGRLKFTRMDFLQYMLVEPPLWISATKELLHDRIVFLIGHVSGLPSTCGSGTFAY